MASSYKTQDLFGSGPHRFSMGLRGVETTARSRLTGNPAHGGTLPLGDEETEVVVRGRLVAASEAALWALRQAIVSAGAFASGAGTLVDHAGTSFPNMWLVAYEEADRVDRGRSVTVSYTARFRDFSAV